MDPPAQSLLAVAVEVEPSLPVLVLVPLAVEAARSQYQAGEAATTDVRMPEVATRILLFAACPMVAMVLTSILAWEAASALLSLLLWVEQVAEETVAKHRPSVVVMEMSLVALSQFSS